MTAMDRLCSACQAGVPHEHCRRRDDLHPADKRRCVDCDEGYNARSARLGSDRCPRCDRRADERRRSR
jgi:hypothetical protein